VRKHVPILAPIPKSSAHLGGLYAWKSCHRLVDAHNNDSDDEGEDDLQSDTISVLSFDTLDGEATEAAGRAARSRRREKTDEAMTVSYLIFES